MEASLLDGAVVRLTGAAGTTALVALHGATLTSVVTGGGDAGQELLFVSAASQRVAGGGTDAARPIRGGVPIVFPQFGPGALPQHGFARTSLWSFRGVEEGAAVFVLDASEATRAVWPHGFQLTYRVRLHPDGFATSLTVRNTDVAAFDFQALLHTYYRVAAGPHAAAEIAGSPGAATAASVHGLGGGSYLDKLQGGKVCAQEPASAVTFTAELDRVYTGAPGALELRGLPGPRRSAAITLSAAAGDGTPTPLDVVVWNPWVAKSAAMIDFGDHEWPLMVCVEPGSVASWRALAPGAAWTLTQEVRV